jgi:hypothetical protein
MTRFKEGKMDVKVVEGVEQPTRYIHASFLTLRHVQPGGSMVRNAWLKNLLQKTGAASKERLVPAR